MSREKLENWAGGFLVWASLILFVFLTVTSLIFTRYFPKDYSEEIPLNRVAVFPLTLLGAAALLTVIVWLGNRVVCSPEKGERRLRILLGLVLGWIFLTGTVWVFAAHSCPISDQAMITSSAERFAQGNYGRLDYGKYLYYYPFQLGLVAYEEQVFRLFGLNRYPVLQILNVVGITVSAFAGYQIVRLLFSRIQAAAYYLLLAGSCISFWLYSVYVYGDALSIAFSMLAVWQFLRYSKKEKKSGIFWMLLFLSVAVMLRNNSLIVLIAILCVLLVESVSRRRWQYFLCACLLLTGTFAAQQALKSHYERISGKAVNDGMPSILWIAMGMQEGDKEAGWYNGYSVHIYQDVCSYDSSAASEIGVDEIKDRAKEFLKAPGYAVDFYWRKFTSQWTEPTYGGFIMTYAQDGERGEFAAQVYEGGANRFLLGFMDCYQLAVYGLVLLLLIRKRKSKEPLEHYILLIAILGGVLFHLLWEAKSRYVLPYFVLMLPMAAAGMEELLQMIRSWRKKKDETAEAGR